MLANVDLVPSIVFLLLGVASGLFARTLWTQRRKFELQNAKMAAIVEASNDAIISKTLTGVVTSWNGGAQKIFGYSKDEMVGRPISVLIPAERIEEEQMILARIIRGETVDQIETIRLRKDGTPIHVSTTVSPIRDKRGKLVGAAKVARDISLRKVAENRILTLNAELEKQVLERTSEIRRYSALQHAIFANAAYAVIAIDTNGTVTMFNPAAERLLGYRADELVGKKTPTLWHDKDEVVERAEEFSLELGMPIEPDGDVFVVKSRLGLANQHDWTFVRKDGKRVPVMLSVSALRDDGGTIIGYVGISTDISKQRQYERELTSARDQLARAAQVAGLGIWTWMLDKDDLFWNPRMFEIYEQPQVLAVKGLSYEHWRQRLHPDDAADTTARLRRAAEGASFFDHTFRIVLPDGRIRHVQAAAQLERDASGRPYRLTGINVDITERIEYEKKLRAAKERADAASEAKSKFVANMSHEIRTPMNAILGMLQLLRRSGLDRRQEEYAAKAEAAGRTLLGIINDVLDFSKMEASKLVLDPHPVKLEKLLQDVAMVTSVGIGDKNVELIFRLDPELPAWIEFDGLRLQQVITNLVGNAVKFTAAGEVEIVAALLEDRGESVLIELRVRDTGIGISPEQRQYVFDSFAQAEGDTTRKFGGTGLGLAISLALVRMMGSELELESTLGVGSTFRFRIECAHTALQAPSDQPNFPRTGRCLVIDDNPSAQSVIRTMIEKLGWSADGASTLDAAEAMLEATDDRPYDVIMLDWSVAAPKLDVTASRLRAVRGGKNVPIVPLVTVNQRAVLAERQAKYPALCASVLTKPILPTKLREALADAISGPEGRFSVDGKLVVRPTRLSGLRLLLVEDNPTNQQVGHDLLTEEGAFVQVAPDGVAGIAAVMEPSSKFDLVLMDIQMPGLDGYAATRAIRQEYSAQELPVIAMTANVAPADRDAALAAGMNEHVPKPFEIDTLVDAILRHTGRRQSSLSSARLHPIRIASTDTPATGLNIDQALQRLGGRRHILQGALLSFVGDARRLVNELPSSPEQERARVTLHTLKGMAATVGASRLAKLCGEVSAELGATLCTPARWSAVRDSIAAEAELAIMSARVETDPNTQPSSFQAPAQSVTPLSGELLSRLLSLLEQSNMEALALYDGAKARFAENDQVTAHQLDDAMARLDFAAAARHCDEILKSLQTEAV